MDIKPIIISKDGEITVIDRNKYIKYSNNSWTNWSLNDSTRDNNLNTPNKNTFYDLKLKLNVLEETINNLIGFLEYKGISLDNEFKEFVDSRLLVEHLNTPIDE